MQYFSPSRLAFINVATPAWSDLVSVSDEVHRDVTAKISAGTHKLAADEDGSPVAELLPVVIPDPQQAEAAYASQLAQLNANYELAIRQIRQTYPLSEAISWTDQVREARAHLAEQAGGDVSEDSIFIDALYASRQAGGIDETKETLCERIVQLHGQITPVIANLTGKRHVIERSLQAAKVIEDNEAAVAALLAVDLTLAV